MGTYNQLSPRSDAELENEGLVVYENEDKKRNFERSMSCPNLSYPKQPWAEMGKIFSSTSPAPSSHHAPT